MSINAAQIPENTANKLEKFVIVTSIIPLSK